MTFLSVNINKIATLRNARGGNVPDLLHAALQIEKMGAHGITVHPRPDERHIRYSDVWDLKNNITTELNVEGYPSPSFLDLVMAVKPHQVTLVPDPPDTLTSNAGWDVIQHENQLCEWIDLLHQNGIRSSIFIDPSIQQVEAALRTKTNRIELYTEQFAQQFEVGQKEEGVEPYMLAAKHASQLGIGVNAGHDLNLHNLKFFHQHVSPLDEVSIGHALISDALYFGLDNTVKMYLNQLV